MKKIHTRRIENFLLFIKSVKNNKFHVQIQPRGNTAAMKINGLQLKLMIAKQTCSISLCKLNYSVIENGLYKVLISIKKNNNNNTFVTNVYVVNRMCTIIN